MGHPFSWRLRENHRRYQETVFCIQLPTKKAQWRNFFFFIGLPVFLRQIKRIFEKYTSFINKLIKNVVLCTFMFINNHLSTDYYQEYIYFDLNKKKLPVTGLTRKKLKILGVTNLLCYSVSRYTNQKNVCWYPVKSSWKMIE